MGHNKVIYVTVTLQRITVIIVIQELSNHRGNNSENMSLHNILQALLSPILTLFKKTRLSTHVAYDIWLALHKPQ